MNLSNSKSLTKAKSKNQYLQFPLHILNDSNPQELRQNMSKDQKIEDSFKSIQKPNPFVALSELKSTEEQYDMIKKRMQVLKLKDQKNHNRYQLNHRKMILHDSIQKLASFEKQRIQGWKHQISEKKEEQRIQNLQQKLVHHKNLQNIIETLKQTKFREYEHRKEEAKSNEQKINQMEQESLSENKNKVQKIKKLLNLSRMSIEVYNKQKMTGLKEKKLKETDSFTFKRQQTEQELKKMLQLEMQMIQRQSTSRLMFHQSNQKLKQLLNPQTKLKSSQVNLKGSKINKNSLRVTQKSFNQSANLSVDLGDAQNLNSSREDKTFNDALSKKNKVNESEFQRLSDSLTRESSFKMQSIKNGFSLPQIKSTRKYP